MSREVETFMAEHVDGPGLSAIEPLTTKDEWYGTIARAVALHCVGGSGPSLTKDAGTTVLRRRNALLDSGDVSIIFGYGKGNTVRVWPMRGGPR